jgi:hypothetical protein
MLIIGATLDRLLAGAEKLRIKKLDKDKNSREFLVSQIDQFDSSGRLDRRMNRPMNSFLYRLDNPAQILLTSEKQRIIWEELQNLRPMRTEHAVPGVPIHSISPEHDTIRR